MPKIAVKFKSNKAAEEFAASFAILGDTTSIEIKESTAIMSSNNPKALRFVRQTTNEYVEEMRYKSMANRLLTAITESINSGRETVLQLMDNSKQKITTHHAEAIASVYDRLSEENQTAFLVLATMSKDTYTHAINFAKSNKEND